MQLAGFVREWLPAQQLAVLLASLLHNQWWHGGQQSTQQCSCWACHWHVTAHGMRAACVFCPYDARASPHSATGRVIGMFHIHSQLRLDLLLSSATVQPQCCTAAAALLRNQFDATCANE
jgi:hypothetical protein